MQDYLKPDIHYPLISQIKFISEQAHIPEKYMRYYGAKEYCTEAEMTWIKKAKQLIREGGGGMVMSGQQEHSVPIKMLAIGATLTRNFIDARVYTLASILDILDDKYAEAPDCTVLIIPDLCISDYSIPKRQIHKLAGYLLERFVADKMLIAYVDSISTVQHTYGDSFATYLCKHYDLFESVSYPQ